MINHFKVINEEQAKNKKIIMRVDFNVPMQNGKIFDDTRIKSIVPGLKILANCAKQIFLLTHFGRPNGIFRPELSVQPLQDYLRRALSCNVGFLPYVDEPSKLKEKADKEEKICLLENCRFYPGEEKILIDKGRLKIPIDNHGVIADVDINYSGAGGFYDNKFILFSGGFFLTGEHNGMLFGNGVLTASRIKDYIPGKVQSALNDEREYIYKLAKNHILVLFVHNF